MSYTIIFDTKFIKLQDGRLLHLDRSGCNNDTAGRDLSDYTGKIYTEYELKKHVESFMGLEKSDDWQLKILGRGATYYDYGSHLLRMAKRAMTYDEFKNERYFSANKYDGVEILGSERKVLSGKEFSDKFYDLMDSNQGVRYRRLFTKLSNEDEIVRSLDEEDAVSFYVGKKHARR